MSDRLEEIKVRVKSPHVSWSAIGGSDVPWLIAEVERLRGALRNLCDASGWFGNEVHKRLGDEFMPYNAAVAFRASRDDALKLLESVLAPKAVES